MEGLKIFDLYNDTEENKINSFNKKTNSDVSIRLDYDKVECNFDWLDIMEDTVKYLDNILRNPNRFIVNEEEVIKIELARRVTVDSIKHLSKNTNFIQEIDKNGDVKPSKILNINKEESYDTYENRFIYSLIQNMKSYIARRKKNLVTNSSLKNNKNLQYMASTEIGKEKINLSMNLETKLKIEDKKEGEEILQRIEKLEQNINVLTYSDVYKVIDKKHITLVMSPIKKTNLIMKNVNFQYATKLWDYLQSHMDDDTKREKKDETIKNEVKTKKYIDELFLISYLALNTVDKNPTPEIKEEITEKLADSMVERILDLNEQLTEEQLMELIKDRINNVKIKKQSSQKEIQAKFKDKIDKYLDKVKNIKI